MTNVEFMRHIGARKARRQPLRADDGTVIDENNLWILDELNFWFYLLFDLGPGENCPEDTVAVKIASLQNRDGDEAVLLCNKASHEWVQKLIAVLKQSSGTVLAER